VFILAKCITLNVVDIYLRRMKEEFDEEEGENWNKNTIVVNVKL
jgi:hypothetical protein